MSIDVAPVGDDRAKIIAALRRGDTYTDIAKAMKLPSRYAVKVIAKQEGIYRGARGLIVTREELDRQVAASLKTKGKAPAMPLAATSSAAKRAWKPGWSVTPTPVVLTQEPQGVPQTAFAEPDSLRQRVLDALTEHGAFSDGRALLDAVRGPGDTNISMDRLGVLLYQMRKENLVKADERKSPNGAAADHGSTRLVNVRLADRMAKADPALAEAIWGVLAGRPNRAFPTVESVRDEVRTTRPSATRGEVILALRDLKAARRVEYDVRKVGPLDEIRLIRAINGHLTVGAGPVTREQAPRPAPVPTPPVPTPVAFATPDSSATADTSLVKWPRLTELRVRAVEAHAKAKAASKLVDAAALLEDVDPEAFELLMARAEVAHKATLNATEEEYLTFAAEGGVTRCIGVTLPGSPCGGYRGHTGRHYPMPD